MNLCQRVVWRIIYLGVSQLDFHLLSYYLDLSFYIHILFLYKTGGSYFQPLSWRLRMKVALGAAKGLAFLHNAETMVIYRDFKTSNILLDSVFFFSFF